MAATAFQYITDVYPERELQGRLDELGSVGWELITAKWEEYSYGGRTQNQARCILKRRVTDSIFEFDEHAELDQDDEFSSTLKEFSRP